MRIASSTQRQFIAAMRTRGLQVHGDLISDGQWHRCDATNKPNGRNDGSYRLFADGPAPWGMYRNWTDGRGVDYWRGDNSRPLTDTEQRELDRRMEEQRIEAEKLAAEAAAEARDRARKDWAEARPALPDHPYLRRKKIKAHDIRVSGTMLLVPMYAADDDDDHNPVNLQLIDGDGTKWFLRGGRAKGCYFPIRGRDEPSTVVLCEGFATGASIAEATGYHVIVAFSASNLVGVADALRAYLNRTAARERREMDKFLAQIPLQPERCPASRFDPKLIIAADDDWKTEGNPGIVAALSAARVSGARVAVPRFGDKRREKETDFNDLAVAFSLAEVKEDIENAVEPNTLLERLLLADPQTAHSAAMVRQLAELKQNDPVRYETLIANLKTKHVRIRPLEQSIKSATDAAHKAGQREEPTDVLYDHWQVEPWDEPVDTGELLSDITKRINGMSRRSATGR
jgi:putative DNA primase/helicase